MGMASDTLNIMIILNGINDVKIFSCSCSSACFAAEGMRTDATGTTNTTNTTTTWNWLDDLATLC